jgi:hypothetical protein
MKNLFKLAEILTLIPPPVNRSLHVGKLVISGFFKRIFFAQIVTIIFLQWFWLSCVWQNPQMVDPF